MYGCNLRQEQAEHCTHALNKHAFVTKERVLWYFVPTPLDIENKFRDMVRSSIKQEAHNSLPIAHNRRNDKCLITGHQQKSLSLRSILPLWRIITFGLGYVGANRIAENSAIKKQEKS